MVAPPTLLLLFGESSSLSGKAGFFTSLGPPDFPLVVSCTATLTDTVCSVSVRRLDTCGVRNTHVQVVCSGGCI